MTKRECKRLKPGDRFGRPFLHINWIEYRVISVDQLYGKPMAFTVQNDIGSEMHIRFSEWWWSGWGAFMWRAERIS